MAPETVSPSRTAEAWIPVVAALACLALLAQGLRTDTPYLPLAAIVAPVAAWLCFQSPVRLIQIGILYLPWSLYLNLGDGFPVASVYGIFWLAALKTLLAQGPKRVPLLFFLLAAYGVFLAISAFAFGGMDGAKSKLLHWFHFTVFYAVIRMNLDAEGARNRVLSALGWSFLINSVASIAIYLLANHLAPSPNDFLNAFIYPLGRILYGARAMEHILHDNNWLNPSGSLKALGFIFNPTQASLIGMAAIGLSAFLLLRTPAGVSRKLLWANLAAGTAYLVLSSGRSGFVTLPLILLVWLAAYVRLTGLRLRPGPVAAAIVVLCGGAILLWDVLVMNVSTLASLDYYSNAGRFISMTAGVLVATHAGWLGFGFGNNPSTMDLPSPSTWIQSGVADLVADLSYNFKSIIADLFASQVNYHSLYLDMLVQTGMIGFVFYLGVLAAMALSGSRKDPALRLGNFAILTAFALSQAVGGDLFYPKVMLYLFAIVACAQAEDHLRKSVSSNVDEVHGR